MLNLLIPALILVMLIVAYVVPEESPPFMWSLVFVVAAGYFVVRGVFSAYRITLLEDGRIECRRLGATFVLHPAEVHSITRSWFKRYLDIRTSRGLILVPDEWFGLESLVGHVRRHNPAAQIAGVPEA